MQWTNIYFYNNFIKRPTNMNTILRALLLQLILLSSCLANVVTVDYQATNSSYSSLSGAFTGNDVNNDGWLTFSELTDWYTNYSAGANFSALNDLGDFNYVSNVWVPNALQWNKTTHDAYMTWNNWAYSASTSNYNWAFVTTVDGSVPEPSSVALLGLAMLGFVAARRKSRK
jgi:hypothetical protein